MRKKINTKESKIKNNVIKRKNGENQKKK